MLFFQVQYEEGQAFADARGAPFIECSAKSNINVGEVFATLLREIERENGMFEEEVFATFCLCENPQIV
jgi:Ras family protein